MEHIDQIVHCLWIAYLISALVVAGGLLWAYDSIVGEMNLEACLVNRSDWVVFLIFLFVLIIMPVLNTLLVLYAIDCYWIRNRS